MSRSRCVAAARPLLLLAALLLVALAAADPEPAGQQKTAQANDKLKIEVLYKPEECNASSKNGDMLTMHYKGTLEDGTQFDSREGKAFRSGTSGW
ncbi:Peptidylprolyl isomerase [Gryllus bimaculatus]|nr:Peptidylprolyl isomerase [Gryllus bimaculatus]